MKIHPAIIAIVFLILAADFAASSHDGNAEDIDRYRRAASFSHSLLEFVGLNYKPLEVFTTQQLIDDLQVDGYIVSRE